MKVLSVSTQGRAVIAAMYLILRRQTESGFHQAKVILTLSYLALTSLIISL